MVDEQVEYMILQNGSNVVQRRVESVVYRAPFQRMDFCPPVGKV